MAAVVWRAVAPPKLKIDEVRLAILAEMNKQAAATKVEFEKTTATWKRQPKFEVVKQLSGGQAQLLVGTNNEIYKFVDEGTRPHTITARNAPYLKFQKGFVAKTKINKIASFRGASFGEWRSPKVVKHPGTKPRNFSKIIAKNIQRQYQRRIEKAVERGLNKAGF